MARMRRTTLGGLAVAAVAGWLLVGAGGARAAEGQRPMMGHDSMKVETEAVGGDARMGMRDSDAMGGGHTMGDAEPMMQDEHGRGEAPKMAGTEKGSQMGEPEGKMKDTHGAMEDERK